MAKLHRTLLLIRCLIIRQYVNQGFNRIFHKLTYGSAKIVDNYGFIKANSFVHSHSYLLSIHFNPRIESSFQQFLLPICLLIKTKCFLIFYFIHFSIYTYRVVIKLRNIRIYVYQRKKICKNSNVNIFKNSMINIFFSCIYNLI